MSKGIAVVTGTSSGIGLHTAIGLATAGHTVVATVRDPNRAETLVESARSAGVSLDIRQLDVTDPTAASRCIDDVITEHGGISILVNNAGRGAVGTLEQLTDAELTAQLEVNYLSVARLTRLVLPGMREAGKGRIVTVTSVGGVVGQPFADAYCAAKFAVEGLMQSLAPVVASFGVTVSIVEPAAVSSEFVGNVAGVGTAQPDPDDPYASLLAAYLRRTSGAFAAAQSPADAAATVVEAATTDQPQFRWQTSEAAVSFAGLSLADLDGNRVLGQTATWLG